MESICRARPSRDRAVGHYSNLFRSRRDARILRLALAPVPRDRRIRTRPGAHPDAFPSLLLDAAHSLAPSRARALRSLFHRRNLHRGSRLEIFLAAGPSLFRTDPRSRPRQSPSFRLRPADACASFAASHGLDFAQPSARVLTHPAGPFISRLRFTVVRPTLSLDSPPTFCSCIRRTAVGLVASICNSKSQTCFARSRRCITLLPTGNLCESKKLPSSSSFSRVVRCFSRPRANPNLPSTSFSMPSVFPR